MIGYLFSSLLKTALQPLEWFHDREDLTSSRRLATGDPAGIPMDLLANGRGVGDIAQTSGDLRGHFVG